ncbi:meteorin-like protein [Spinachia spinachia]
MHVVPSPSVWIYICVGEMLPSGILLMCFVGLRSGAADLCNWTGSGFAAGVDSRIVLQVQLRCTEGSVRWIYPGQALRVVLEPNLSTAGRTTVCIKPSPSLRGASVFIERAGELELLRTERALPEQRVFCLRADGPQRPAIYLQSSPQSDGSWSRRTMGFRYELLSNRSAAPIDGHTWLQASCQPCNNTQLLMAICNSDFVVRGFIHNVSHDSQRGTSLVEVSAQRVYWQRSGVFEQRAAAPGSPPSPAPRRGRIHTLVQCRVRPGGGEFLFTGSEHFGEAWLGCAPRYKDFLSVYQAARAARRNSCDFPLD